METLLKLLAEVKFKVAVCIIMFVVLLITVLLIGAVDTLSVSTIWTNASSDAKLIVIGIVFAGWLCS